MGRPQQGQRDQSQCPLPVRGKGHRILEGRCDVCRDPSLGSSMVAAVGPCDSGPGRRTPAPTRES
eukprot:282986-Alexandrium_andersonii.AAC.1